MQKQSSPAPVMRHPLGLPSGSVRALLTLLIVAVVVMEVVRGQHVSLLWTETLMIALAHYFTSRRFIQLPPEIMRRLAEEGHIEAEDHPLYLPKHSIRTLIILAFVGLATYQYEAGRIMQSESLSILITVFAYLLGVVGGSILQWWTKRRPSEPWMWWADLKAIAVLVAMGSVAIASLLNVPDELPKQLQLTTLGLVLFYFGSR